MASPDRQKIIIDTDCGIDDAIALLLALSSKDIADVIAITCCFGNTSLDNVCSNVMRVLTVCEEREIPIHRGCNGPLIKHELNSGLVHGSDGLGNCAHEFSTGDLKESDIPAPVALINLAKKYPKQITLVAIGPLTNLAVAHRIDPEFTKNLKSISIMGGNYKGIGNTTEVAEFNFFCDPESANMVVTEALCPIVLVPWETTMEFGIPWDFYYELAKIDSPKGYFFKRTTANFKRKRDTHPDCDFLAVIAVLYPHAIRATLKSHIEVECKRGLTKGLTVLLRDSARTENRSKIDIITCYDKEDLYTELQETKTKKGEFFKVATKLHMELSEECYESYIDCDFLPTAAALYPDCVKSSEKHFLVVELSGTYTRGLTILQRDKSFQKTKVEIVTDFHKDALVKLRKKMLKTVL